jgi:hypothetical protein
MRAVDPTVGLVGPAVANPNPVYSPWSSVDTACVTTHGLRSSCANGDPGWLSTEDYVPMLLRRGKVKPSAVSMHAYGTSSSITPEDSTFSAISGWAVPSFNASDKAAVDAADVPVWITEANVDAAYEGSPIGGKSYRSATQMGSAWITANLINWAQDDSHIQKIFDFATDGNNASFMLWGKSNESANGSCVPRPACTYLRPQQPDQQYWSIYELNHLLGSGGKLVPLSNVPSGFQAMAVQTDAHTVVLVVVNEHQGNNDGNGAPGAFEVQLRGATVKDVQQTAINGSTSMADGPATTHLGARPRVEVHAAGYEVDFLKFTVS